MTKRLAKSRRDHNLLMQGLYGVKGANGAANGTGVTVRQAPSSGVRQIVLTLANTPIPLVDEAGVVAYGSLKVWDAPEGAINILGAVANLTVGKSSAGVVAAWNGDFAVGTAAASNNASLSSTEANIIPSTAIPAATAGNSTAKGVMTTPVSLDGTSAGADVYLNVLVDDADQDVTATPANLIFNGTITLTVVFAGDK